MAVRVRAFIVSELWCVLLTVRSGGGEAVEKIMVGGNRARYDVFFW